MEPDNNIELTRNCLALIQKIAADGAQSTEAVSVEHAFHELSYLFVERIKTLVLFPVPDESEGMPWLLSELTKIDQCQQDLKTFCRNHQVGMRGR